MHDLPIYGQALAYGIALAGVGFGLRQIVRALSELTLWLKSVLK